MTKQNKIRGGKLAAMLDQLAAEPPPTWRETGVVARPNLHGLLRYPAMMVPRMQGDIIDAVLSHTGRSCHIVDPFVGSGTTLTESTLRGVDFTGIDINPLAALVCEAKAAVSCRVDIESAAITVMEYLRSDFCETIDIDFQNRDKWFSDEAARRFSRLRRAISKVGDSAARKVMWVVFAETVRLCSNSRTSTYKLHVRKAEELVSPERIDVSFENGLRQTLARVTEYNRLAGMQTRTPLVKVICGDSRKAQLPESAQSHQIIVTSPPYGDNQTTIPYGQFSYLALRWIPKQDLPNGFDASHLSNTHALDTASLGGSNVDADHKGEAMRLASPNFDAYYKAAIDKGGRTSARKVASFMYDFLEALSHLRASANMPAHWIFTTGNRTAGGIRVPFDLISQDIVKFLGGTSVATLGRDLPSKRMPSRNSMGEMITSETTLVAEFA